MGHFAASSAKRPTATIGFDCRFLAAAPPGAWIDGRVIMRRLTRTLAFVDGEAERRRNAAGHGERDF